MHKGWLIGLSLFVLLFVGPFPLLYGAIFFLLPIYCSSVLIERTDLTNFQLLALFFITWFVPIAGPIATLHIVKNILPREQME